MSPSSFTNKCTDSSVDNLKGHKLEISYVQCSLWFSNSCTIKEESLLQITILILD